MLITYTVNKSKSLKAANRSCHAYAMAHSALVANMGGYTEEMTEEGDNHTQQEQNAN